MARVWLLFGLLFLLAGCLESEATLRWRADGSIDLEVRVADAPAALGEGLRRQGFWVRAEAGALLAWRPLKAAGWDRLSGWLPGRFAYQDPSGVVFSRTSYVVFEDYRLSGRFVPLKAAGLPPWLASAPFRFVVEAPFAPIRSNAKRQEGRRQVWEGTLGATFAPVLVYRIWYPERGLALLAALSGLVLWRRSRRPRAG